MERWIVSDIRWANKRDLNLPFWRKWNENNPLPQGFWKRIWEYPYLCSKIPSSERVLDIGSTHPDILFKNYPNAQSVNYHDLNKLDHPLHFGKWPENRLILSDPANIPIGSNFFEYVFCISAIEGMPLDVIREMVRIAKFRVIITVDVSDVLGLPVHMLRELEDFLKIRIPPLPVDALVSSNKEIKKFRQKPTKEYDHIRILAFTIDSRDTPKSVGIIIPHWNSWPFLKICLENIQKYRNSQLNETVYVIDDLSDDGSFERACEFFKDDISIQFHQVNRKTKNEDADVGYLLDYGLSLIEEQYVAMIDADIIPLSKDWLSFPIWIQEKYNCSSVGLDTGLSGSYTQRIPDQKWWQPQDGYIPHAGLYDNQWFICTNNLYRIMHSSTAKIVSNSIGYTRNCNDKNSLKSKILRKGVDFLKFNFINRRYPYFPGCEDNGVAANHFLDINAFGPKFNFPITSFIGFTPNDGVFGQNISGMIFHFALSTRALSHERREVEDAGKDFYYWVRRIQGEFDEQLVSELINASKSYESLGSFHPVDASWYKKEYMYIEKLHSIYLSEIT